jgi:hypothetical protein
VIFIALVIAVWGRFCSQQFGRIWSEADIITERDL